MRILLATKYWRTFGGVEEHAFVVKRFLEDAGHEVIPFSTENEENLPTPYSEYFVSDVDFRDGSVAHRAHAVGRATFGLQTIRNLRRLLKHEQIDAAHVLHTYHQMGMSFLLELKRQGVPVILSLHDYKIACPSYRYFSDRTGTVCTRCLDHKSGLLWAPAAERCWGGSALAGATLSVEAAFNRSLGVYRKGPGAVIVLNELQRRSVEAAGVAPEKIHLIPHFLDLPEIPAGTRGRHMLYVGRLVPEKGVDVLIRACARAAVPLRIVGDGRDRDTLRQLADDLGASVEFTGTQPSDAVASEMRQAMALVVPSLWHEVSPLVVLEAIANNCPVVGTITGGIPDLIGDGRGVLVQPGEVEALARALSEVAAEPELRQRLTAEASRYAAVAWTRQAWADRLVDAYAAAGATLAI